jgi:hypothetical protein
LFPAFFLDYLALEDEKERPSRNVTTTNQRCVTSQKSEDLNYTAVEA